MDSSLVPALIAAAVIMAVLALIAYIVKKLGASIRAALLISGIIIALSTLLTQLPPIIQSFQAPRAPAGYAARVDEPPVKAVPR